MPGRLLAVEVSEGQTVAEGQGLFIVEAMKMENEIRASHAGRVVGVAVAEGEPVEQEQVLCHLVVGGAGASGRAPGGAS
jgi:biotin carboxyl carrier protein